MYRKKGKFIYGLAVLVFGIALLSGTNAFGILPGNVDGKEYLNLKDAVLSLQISSGIPASAVIDADIDKDGFIGIAEAVYAMQVTAGIRPSTLFIINAAGTALESMNTAGTALENVQISLLDSSLADPVNLGVFLPGDPDSRKVSLTKDGITSYDPYTYIWTGAGDGLDSVLLFADEKNQSLSGCIDQSSGESYYIQAPQSSEGVYTVTNTADTCAISIRPYMELFGTSGGDGRFDVISCCNWTASSFLNWITVTSGSSDTGDRVAYSVSPSESPCDPTKGYILVLASGGQGWVVFEVERSPVPCDYTFDPAESPDFLPSGGSGIVSVQTDLCCELNPESDKDWIKVDSVESGKIYYSLSDNQSCDSRSGKIILGNDEFVVNQDGIDCNSSISITPIGKTFTVSAQEGSIAVTAPDCCDWTSVSSVPSWLTVLSGSSGTGNGTVVFSITESMLCESRVGKITIGIKEFTVTQKGIDCNSSISITPIGKTFTSSAQEGSITVTAPSCCSWTADMSQAPSWLSLTSENSGTGNGTVSYAISANTSGESRTAKIIIAGIEFTVTQDDSQPEETYTNSLGMTFQYIPAGSFIMGSPEDELGRQGDEVQETVVIENYYYLQTTEVTQYQWISVMGYNPSEFQKGGAYPVENVSWDEAKNFLASLNSRNEGTYRLPTEKEWEYAARAGSTTALNNGDIVQNNCYSIDPNLNAVGWYCGNANDTTQEVGKKSANAWKLYDMHGNVWEWCEDASPDNPVLKVIRGGSWESITGFVRSANKAFSGRSCKCHGVTGLRLVWEP